VDLLRCHSKGISRILNRERGHSGLGGFVTKKCFIRRCKNQAEPWNIWSRTNWKLFDKLWQVRLGKDYQDSILWNYISKGSRSMFVRQLDMLLHIVNKVVKQDLKWQRSGLNMSQSLWHRTQGITLNMDIKCKSKPEKSSKFIQYSISFYCA